MRLPFGDHAGTRSLKQFPVHVPDKYLRFEPLGRILNSLLLRFDLLTVVRDPRSLGRPIGFSGDEASPWVGHLTQSCATRLDREQGPVGLRLV